VRLQTNPEYIKRCIYLSETGMRRAKSLLRTVLIQLARRLRPLCCHLAACVSCAPDAAAPAPFIPGVSNRGAIAWARVRLLSGAFPEEPGPREIIIPHNPMITREMDIQTGDILIGRPWYVLWLPNYALRHRMNVDKRTGVIVWCVTGRSTTQKGFKDLATISPKATKG